MGVLLMVMILIFAIKRKYERHSFNFKRFIMQFLYSIPALGSPLIILSGFTLGWFTPTEASSIAVIYSLIIALVVYRSMTWESFKKCLKDSAISSAAEAAAGTPVLICGSLYLLGDVFSRFPELLAPQNS